MKHKTFTLITGASTGLGKELALACASQNRNLLLTALPGEKIEFVGEKIRKKYKIEVECYEVDLTQNGSVEKLSAEIFRKYEIDMLINNAGIGGTLSFMEAPPNYIDQIILLNMRALVLLTRLLLPMLKKHQKSYILNIASMASFGPMPFKTVYPASKAFVYSFSRGLGEELKGTGISVSVAHPGGMKTNAEVTRRIEKHSKLIQLTTLPVKRIAEICIRQTLRKDKLIIPGTMNKISWLMLKIIPVWLRLKIMRNSLQNELK
mgnify:CR=1 FL=1